MATTTRIKVRRDTLLRKLVQERARLTAAHEKAEFDYDRKIIPFLQALEGTAEAFIELLATDPDKALTRVSSSYDGGKVTVSLPGLKQPSAPTLDTRQLDKMISILDSAADEFISVAANDDYARYL